MHRRDMGKEEVMSGDNRRDKMRQGDNIETGSYDHQYASDNSFDLSSQIYDGQEKGDERRDDAREERRTEETMRDGNDRRDEERKGKRQRQ